MYIYIYIYICVCVCVQGADRRLAGFGAGGGHSLAGVSVHGRALAPRLRIRPPVHQPLLLHRGTFFEQRLLLVRLLLVDSVSCSPTPTPSTFALKRSTLDFCLGGQRSYCPLLPVAFTSSQVTSSDVTCIIIYF